MKAVKKFKGLVDGHTKGPNILSNALDKGLRSLEAVTSRSAGLAETSEPVLQRSKSDDHDDRDPIESALAAEGVHRNIKETGPFRSQGNVDPLVITRIDSDTIRPAPKLDRVSSDEVSGVSILDTPRGDSPGEKGHAHDPLDGEPLFLGIGAGENDSLEPPAENLIAESPTAADFPIYVTAYEEEVQRIREAQGQAATVYSTRRVDEKKKFRKGEGMAKVPQLAMGLGLPAGALKGVFDRAKDNGDGKTSTNQSFSDLASRIVGNSKEVGKDLLQKAGDKRDEIMEKRAEGKDK